MQTDSPSPTTLPRIGLSDVSVPRRRVRHKMNIVLYVKLDQGNGGIICDLSEYGLAVQAVAALRIHQHVLLRFDLPRARSRVEVVGQVVWATATGKAGIQFTQISPRTRQTLKDWLLTNLLAIASDLSGMSGILGESAHITECSELTFSAAPRPVIRLPNTKPEENSLLDAIPGPLSKGEPASLTADHGCICDQLSDEWLEFSWWPVPVAARTLSGAVDALVLLVSLLLFSSVFLAISHQVPPWPTTVMTSVGVLLVFACLYRFLFVNHGVGTVGFRLACLAAGKPGSETISQQECTRFR